MKVIQTCKVKDYLPINEIELHPDNPRTINASRMRDLKASIIEKGFYEPILVWKNEGYVLSGNHRLKAVRELVSEGWTIGKGANAGKLPVVMIDEDESVATQILFETNNRYAEWIDDKVRHALADADDETRKGFGFTDAEVDLYLRDAIESANETLAELESSMDDIDNMPQAKGVIGEHKPDDEREEVEYEDLGLTDPDSIPEVEENPYGVQLGDIWQLGDHRLMCGDATNMDDINQLMDGKRAVFCFTSPPYSDMRDYGGGIDLSPEYLSDFLKAPVDLYAVNLGIQCRDREVVEYYRPYIDKAKQIGLKFLSWNVWDKDMAGGVSNQNAMFSIIHEWIFVFGEYKKLNRIFKNKGDVEDRMKRYDGHRYDPSKIKGMQRLVRQADGTTKYSTVGELHEHKQMATICYAMPEFGSIRSEHPATFPVLLPEQYYLGCTDEKDLVYEPFCGSGTCLIAAERLRRVCYSMEINPHYCGVAIKRWEGYTGKKATKQDQTT